MRSSTASSGALQGLHRVGQPRGSNQEIQVDVRAQVGPRVHRFGQHRALEGDPRDARGVEGAAGNCQILDATRVRTDADEVLLLEPRLQYRLQVLDAPQGEMHRGSDTVPLAMLGEPDGVHDREQP